MKEVPHQRIKSYVLRQGRVTPSQRRALEKDWEKYGLAISDGPLGREKIFGRVAPCVLEIGFGNGESLLSQSVDTPEKDFIGVEVHSPGVGHLMAKACEHGVNNLRVYREDVIEVLYHCIQDHSLDVVQVFFPDPWPKKRHHKRRLINSTFVELLARKIKRGGVLHCATDWENYAVQMMDVLTASKHFKNVVANREYYPDPYALRPKTKFENRGLNLNHVIRDLIFERF